MGLIIFIAFLLIAGVAAIVLNSKYGKVMAALTETIAAEKTTARRDDYGRTRTEAQLGEAKFIKRIAFICVFACFGLSILVFVLSTFRVIGPGHVGVPVLFGEVQIKQLPEGLNVVNPLYSVISMDCRVQKAEGKYDAASKDMQNVHVTMALNFEVIPVKACEVYQRVGVEYVKIIIDPAAQEVLKAHTALYNASDILQKRPQIKMEVQDDLAKWLLKYGIRLKEISLANISFDKDYEQAISRKQVEEQKAEQKRYELIQAERQAEIAKATAKGLADAVREDAKGNADATRLKGDAEAYYNDKVSKSLSQILIQQQYYKTWNGELPKFMMSDGKSSFLLQLPADEEKKK